MKQYIILLCVIFGIYLYLVKALFPEEKLLLVQCQVGQGDALYLRYQSYDVVVDGGPDASVLECLRKYHPSWDTEIEVLIATHPDADHIAGLVPILQQYKVGSFFWNGQGKDTKIYQTLAKELEMKHLQPQFLGMDQSLRLQELSLQGLWPPGSSAVKTEKNNKSVVNSSQSTQSANQDVDDANHWSMVLRVKFRGFTALLTGDLPVEPEHTLVSSGVLGLVNLLKVGHHGSKNSSSSEFLEKLHPQWAFIGVGKNTYGHPTNVVLQRLRNLGAKIYRTDQQGDLILKTDGQGVEVTTTVIR